MCSRRAAWLCSLALALLALLAPSSAAAAEYDVQFVTFGVPKNLTAGQVFTLPVGVTNTGTAVWERGFCETSTDYRVGGHWRRENELADFEEDVAKGYQPMRAQIPAAMKPGDSQKVLVFLQAPSVPGKYTLRLDMIKEGSFWFESQGAKLVEMPVEVKAATATPEVEAVIPWEPLFTPGFVAGKGQRVYVTRTAPCPVVLSFSDKSPNVMLTAEQALWVTNFPKPGTYTVTATGSGGCTGSVSADVEVTDDTCPFILPVKVCTLWDFDCCAIDPVWCPVIELPGPPHVTEVIGSGEFGINLPVLHPGDWTGIDGDHFVVDKVFDGKAEMLMHDFQGNERVVTLAHSSWGEESILVHVPLDLSGYRDQTVNIRVTRSDGKTSNLYPIILAAIQDSQLLPPALVTATCDNQVACNQCNGAVDCGSSGFPAGPPFTSAENTSIVGGHQSIPALSTFGICAGGGGFGTDRYAVHLENGWHLGAFGTHKSGNEVSFHDLTVGASDFEVSVGWNLDSCESAYYRVDLVVEGPRGVPLQ